MVDTILVPFHGEGGGVDTLSWGQREIWGSMTAVGASLTLAASYPAAPGTTVRKVLRTIPGRRFGTPTDRREPRWWQIGYHSPASFPAVHAIAARNNVRTTPVLLAGFAVALCRLTGTDVAATWPAGIRTSIRTR